MVFGWENSLGWLAFLSLLPLILLYLIRPRPQEIEVPSLMFFMKSKTHRTKNSFFQKLSKDWLFLVQLLIFILLAFTFIDPYTTLDSTFFTQHTILVVDISASTQANNNQVFQDIIAEAKNHLGKTNTILLVSTTPRTALKAVTKKDALRYLNALTPTDSRSHIGEAILLAEKHITSDKDRVIVISDFLSTSTTDIHIAKNTLISKGISVRFIPIASEKAVNNIGIIDLAVGKETSIVTLKNYMHRTADVTLRIGKHEETLSIPTEDIITHTFQTPSQPTAISLVASDAFTPDNDAYITLPREKQIKVLLISDTPSFYLQTALTSSDLIHLDTVGSGSFREGYDVYILGDVRELPGVFLDKLKQRLQEGASIIIHAGTNTPALPFGDLLPLKITGVHGKALITHEQLTRFTQDITFENVDRYYTTQDPQGVVLATAEGNAILTLKPVGEGNIIYYGILEDSSDFELNPSYPIFWTTLVRYLAKVESIEDINVPTGTVLSFSTEKKIKTPLGMITTDIIILENRGIYSFDDKTYAASLKNERESDLRSKTAVEQNTVEDNVVKEESFRYPLFTLLIFASIFFLFVEIVITKLQGEVS
ncbi:MAG: BatA domain-containing protein [Nanoarchaeota archaeon]